MIVLQFGAIAVLGSRLNQVTHGGGPSAAGFYVVVVPRATADRALERLRNQTSVVRFVEAMPPG